ncbi:Wortmanamides biosynthesis cluster C-like protein [Cladobotryum mycophilum]|uniref:Wortmanamides biosynthesis cluster C-like protein n=1 Tax=Cladobotryum mycophilum TaxID=491253 RepID=A0ABR0SVT2_9HYPO
MASPAPAATLPNGMSHRYAVFVITNAVFTFLSLLAVILRFQQRRLIKAFSWDDWLILGSLICSIGTMVDVIISTAITRAGYHITTYTIPQLETFLKVFLANVVIYNFCTMFARSSVLFFYRRIFSINRVVLRIIQTLSVLNFLACLSAVLGLIFSTSPVRAQWDLSIPSKSLNHKAFWISLGLVTFVIDVSILAIPQAQVWKLQLSWQRRLALSLVFLLGGFVCFTTIVRIVYLARVDMKDVTYSIVQASIWTTIETNMSIICACLPVIYSLFKVINRKDANCQDKVVKSPPQAIAEPCSEKSDYEILDSASSAPSADVGYHVAIQSTDATHSAVLASSGPICIERTYAVI